MSCKSWPILAIALPFSFITATASSQPATGPILLNTSHFPPLQMEKDGQVDGPTVRLVRCALDKIRQPFKIQVLPWARAQQDVKDGKAEAYFAAFKNEERDAYGVASEPIYLLRWNWYLPKDSKADPKSDDFKNNAKVATLASSDNFKSMQTKGYKQVSSGADGNALMKMLVSGHVQGVMLVELFANDGLKALKMKPDQLRVENVSEFPVRTYFSKPFLAARPDFLKKFNQAVEHCQKK